MENPVLPAWPRQYGNAYAGTEKDVWNRRVGELLDIRRQQLVFTPLYRF